MPLRQAQIHPRILRGETMILAITATVWVLSLIGAYALGWSDAKLHSLEDDALRRLDALVAKLRGEKR